LTPGGHFSERFHDLEAVKIELIERGRLTPGADLVPLDGGVSCLVGLSDNNGSPFVVKAARTRLAVEDEWLADPSRSLRESAILSLLDGHLGPMRVPRVLFTEPELNLIGLEAILPIRSTWKEDLLEGVVEPTIGQQVGLAMAALHLLEPTPILANEAGTALFRGLRVEPYYIQVAKVLPELAHEMEKLSSEAMRPVHPTLVQGDVTPKNVIPIGPASVMLDFEVIHLGEPAFDPSMLFAHFVLKAIYRLNRSRARAIADLIDITWQAYQSGGGPAEERLVTRHMGGIILARLWGKSRVMYLQDAEERLVAESVGRSLLGGRSVLSDVPALIQELM
jgi:hypothetical protein